MTRVNDHYRRLAENKGKAEILIGKNRQGPRTTVELRFDAESMTFSDPFDDTMEQML